MQKYITQHMLHMIYVICLNVCLVTLDFIKLKSIKKISLNKIIAKPRLIRKM